MEKTKPTLLNISKHLQSTFTTAIRKAFPLPDFTAEVKWSTAGSSDLCSPSAMKIFNMNSKKEGWTIPSSKEVAQEIISVLEKDDIIGEVRITQQLSNKKPEQEKKEKEGKEKDNKKQKQDIASYFIDIDVNPKWLEETSIDILRNGLQVQSVHTNRKVLVDFSSPNIAKEMHVGHLRGTILGDTICRILEYLGNDVKRINHVGDWGTQFGMLIALLQEESPNFLVEAPEISDLEAFYIRAKKKFESDEEFKKKAYERTVQLQKGDKDCREAWQFICDISREDFNKLYDRLDIKLEEMGESFYDPICRKIVPELEEKGLVVLDEGAKIMKIPGQKTPMMLVKSDGGLTYDTTDIAAMFYRFTEMKRDWIIYVIGSEQELHLKLLFEAGKLCGWHHPPDSRLDHMAYGLILGKDGKKISTRNPTGDPVKLIYLLDEAKARAKNELETRMKEHNTEFTDEYIETASSRMGYSAVKYYDLKQYRMSQYKLDYDQMLDYKGNTAVYLFYSYVRMCSLYRKSNITDESIKELIQKETIKITHPKEKELLLHLLRFNDVLDDLLDDLAINKLTDYVYGIAVRFSEFYEECKIQGDPSRLLIVELTKRFMKLSFDLLGMTPIEKI
jgi:arginyl-tRNA synthetase